MLSDVKMALFAVVYLGGIARRLGKDFDYEYGYHCICRYGTWPVVLVAPPDMGEYCR